jgi:hypothetical protein
MKTEEKSFVFFDKRIRILLVLIVVLDVAMMTLGPRATLDMKLYYTGEQARSLLSSFDAHEGNTYFINELFDLVFISAYSSLFFFGLRKAFPKSRIAGPIALVPGFFDVIETSFILYALRTQGPHPFFDWLGVATFLKWTTGSLVNLTMIVGSIRKSRTKTR